MSTKDVASLQLSVGTNREFAAWLGHVDYLLRTRFGLHLSDTSYDYRDAFDMGQTPAVAAALGVMAR